MEKTEIMNQIEHEAELNATIQTGTCGELPRWWYVLELERRLEKVQAKAAAYDRLMSGGKKTLKEWANILGMPFAVDYNGDGFAFPKTPVCYVEAGGWDSSGGGYIIVIPCHLIDFNGDWRESLTLPDGREGKQ